MNILNSEDIKLFTSLNEAEVNIVTAQMTALLQEMVYEKGHMNNMITMLQNQSWFNRCISTISGTNKATVKEIENSKDKLSAYIAEALSYLFEINKIEQSRMIALGEAINHVNLQLNNTNIELFKTQENMYSIKKELIQSISKLSDSLNGKIDSFMNFQNLKSEIEDGAYEKGNVLSTLLLVISQFNRYIINNEKSLETIKRALQKNNYLSDEEIPIKTYMEMLTNIKEDIAGPIYFELFCVTGNEYSEIFSETMERCVLLDNAIKKAKRKDIIIKEILDKHQLNENATLTTIELYEYFVESKKKYFANTYDNNTKNVFDESQDDLNIIEDKKKSVNSDNTENYKEKSKEENSNQDTNEKNQNNVNTNDEKNKKESTNQEKAVIKTCSFNCVRPGENSEATCSPGNELKLGERVIINGEQDLSSIIQFNNGGCVYGIRLIKNPSKFSLCGFEFEIEVTGSGPQGFLSGAGYLRFYDKTGDHYDLSILKANKDVHVTDFSSDIPLINKIMWSNTSF